MKPFSREMGERTPGRNPGSPSPVPSCEPVRPLGKSAAPCCGDPGASVSEAPYYEGFVDGSVDTPAGPVLRGKTTLGPRDVAGRWRMRWGVGRSRYRAPPGCEEKT